MRALAVTALGLMIVAGSSLAQQAVPLKYRYAEGTSLRYADTMTVQMTQEMMGQEVKGNQSIVAVTRYAVEAVIPGGGARLITSTDTMRVHVKNPRVDTTIVPVEALHKRIRLTVTPEGVVTAREIVDSIKMSSFLRASGGVASREMLRLPVLPVKPVKTGEKWTSTKVDSTKTEGGSSILSTTMEYTLVGMEKFAGRSCAKLSYTGKLAVNTKGSMMGMEVFTEGTGTVTGFAYFDNREGIFVGDEGKTDMELTAAVTGQQNMTIPISQSTKTKHILLAD